MATSFLTDELGNFIVKDGGLVTVEDGNTADCECCNHDGCVFTVGCTGVLCTWTLPAGDPVPAVGDWYRVDGLWQQVQNTTTTPCGGTPCGTWAPTQGPQSLNPCDGCVVVQPAAGGASVSYSLPNGNTPPVVGQYYRIGGTCWIVVSVALNTPCNPAAPVWAPESGPYPTNTCLSTGVMCILAQFGNPAASSQPCTKTQVRLTLPAGNPMPQVGMWYNWRGWCIRIISVTAGACVPAADQTWDWPGVTYGPSTSYCFPSMPTTSMCSANWECYCDLRTSIPTVTQDSVRGNTVNGGVGNTCQSIAGQPCAANTNTGWPALALQNYCFGGGTSVSWGSSTAGAVAISLTLTYTATAQTLNGTTPGLAPCKEGSATFSVPANSWYFTVSHSSYTAACGTTPTTIFEARGVANVSCSGGQITASGTTTCSFGSSAPAVGCNATYSFSIA